MQLYQPTITGSLSVSGSINISGSINVVGGGGTITGTASYATNADLLDGLDSTVFTLTSSFAAQTASFTAFTASILSYTASQNILNGTYATTGSNTFAGIQTINSNLTVTGSITAQTLIVSTINATQSYSSGSNIFGNASSNTQTFTGSVNITGSLTVVTTGTEFQVNATGVKMGNVIGDTHSITGSVGISGSLTGVDAIFNVNSNKRISTYAPSSWTGISDYVTSGVGWQFTRPNDDALAHAIFTFNGTSTNNLAISSRSDLVIATGGGLGSSDERMRITSTGNVGIGTSTMAYVKLNVYNNTNDATYNSKIQAVFGPADYQDSDAIQNYGSGTSETQFLVGNTGRPAMLSLGGDINTGEAVGVINFFRSTNTDTYRSRAWIWSGINTTGTANQHGGFLAFSTAADSGTNPQERMRISSGGAATELVKISNSLASGDPVNIQNLFTAQAPNNQGAQFLYCGDTSALRLKIVANGGIHNYQSNNVNLSDRNTKKEIALLDSYWNKFKAIEIVKFKYIDQTHDDFNIGVIAQQVEEVAPEFVDTSMWDLEGEEVERKAIYTADLYHATIKVLQEAMAKIESLQEQINILAK